MSEFKIIRLSCKEYISSSRDVLIVNQYVTSSRKIHKLLKANEQLKKYMPNQTDINVLADIKNFDVINARLNVFPRIQIESEKPIEVDRLDSYSTGNKNLKIYAVLISKQYIMKNLKVESNFSTMELLEIKHLNNFNKGLPQKFFNVTFPNFMVEILEENHLTDQADV